MRESVCVCVCVCIYVAEYVSISIYRRREEERVCVRVHHFITYNVHAQFLISFEAWAGQIGSTMVSVCTIGNTS